jgi:putative FmdB family regulatory protein
MPTYEYACRSCEERLEVVQSFSDDALTTCESCGGELRKVFSAAGLIFKGSGWHIKDYSSSSKGAAGTSGTSGTSSTTSSGEPAAKPAPSSTSASTSADKGGSGATTASTGSTTASSGD